MSDTDTKIFFKNFILKIIENSECKESIKTRSFICVDKLHLLCCYASIRLRIAVSRQQLLTFLYHTLDFF